jgi:hypothetical protein
MKKSQEINGMLESHKEKRSEEFQTHIITIERNDGCS